MFMSFKQYLAVYFIGYYDTAVSDYNLTDPDLFLPAPESADRIMRIAQDHAPVPVNPGKRTAIRRETVLQACQVHFITSVLQLQGIINDLTPAVGHHGEKGEIHGRLKYYTVARLRNAGPAVAVATLVKLLLMPVFMWGWTAILGVDGLPQAVAIVAGGVPSAAASYILARKMGGDAALVALILTAQTLVAAVTLPFIITLAKQASGLN